MQLALQNAVGPRERRFLKLPSVIMLRKKPTSVWGPVRGACGLPTSAQVPPTSQRRAMGLTERPDSPAMGAQPEQRGAPWHPELREGLGAPGPEPEAAGVGEDVVLVRLRLS